MDLCWTHLHSHTCHARDHQQSELLGRWVVHGNQLQQNTSNTLLTLHCERKGDAKAGSHASATGRQPTFQGVTLDTRLTWKTHLEAVAARSVRKLGLLKKLAGTTWGADTNILRRVYTGAVRPIMEYATTSWATASNANKSKLDKVQNVALRAIVGAMKTTPIKEMEKRADLEPLELRRAFKVLTQTEKIRRLPGHPLYKKLAAPTKNRLKRQSLNHLARDLRRTHEDILDPQINEGNNLCSRDWNQDDLRATIFLEVPGLLPAEQQIPAQQMALTLEMLEEIYPQAGWTHIYTDGSAEEAVRNGDSGVFVRTPTGQTFGYSNATGKKFSNFKAETSALQNAVACIAEMKPQKTVILTDSKAAFQSLTFDTPDQPIHQPTAERPAASPPWMHCGPTVDPFPLWDSRKWKSNCNPRPPPRTRKPKPCSETDKNVNGKEPLETTFPQLTQSTVWQDMSKPLYSGCEQDTVACERTWSEVASWTLHSAIAKKQNRWSTTSSRTVPSGGNRDTSYGRRMSQPPTSCGERRKTCAAPPSSWQHVDWGSEHGWSTAEEEVDDSSNTDDENNNSSCPSHLDLQRAAPSAPASPVLQHHQQ